MPRPTARPTLVMGAGGSIGHHVLAGLLARDVAVRASARRPRPGQFPADVSVVVADLTEPESLTTAFDGVGAVFLYADQASVRPVIHAARAAGVQKIVLLSSGSVLRPTSRGNPITQAHRDVEEAFADAPDLTVVPVRPLVLAANALRWSYPIKAGSALMLYAPEALTAPIHEKDVAGVVVAALTGADTDQVSGLLTGPTLMTQREQVAAIAAATGRQIAVQELTRQEALEQFARHMPAGEADAVVQFLDDAAAGNSPVTTTVEDVLGRPPFAFDVWAADHASDFA